MKTMLDKQALEFEEKLKNKGEIKDDRKSGWKNRWNDENY